MASSLRRSTWSFGFAIFLGAWLIFQIQPLMSKLILPWFGGTPQVWTVCLLFFQSVLFAGYVFAHLLQVYCSRRTQVIVFIGLLAGALLATPVLPTDDWKPAGFNDPTLQILLLLVRFIGLPYLLLSATGPLLQSWYHKALPNQSPYWLYALSNAGSLLGLLAYPFAVDILFPSRVQVQLWLGCYVAYLASAAVCGYLLVRAPEVPKDDSRDSQTSVRSSDRLMWFLLAMVPTILLAAVTSKLSVDISPMPFLWVVPLTLYLLSLIVCFAGPNWYSRLLWSLLLAMSLWDAAYLLLMGRGVVEYGPLPLQFLAYLGLLFSACMVCHGELVRLKPHHEHLTEFYLWMSAGGAAGGFFTGILAPLIFSSYFELHVGMVACYGLFMVVCFRDAQSPLYRGGKRRIWVVMLIGLVALMAALGAAINYRYQHAHLISRNFYGSLRLVERNLDDPKWHFMELAHGGTRHGMQYLSPDRRRIPTTYYGEQSGIGRLLRHDPGRSRRVAVVGLGVGTLAAYGRSDDRFDFFEINPLVLGYAQSEFYYLRDSAAECQIIPGDARISLERLPPQNYDVLALDAFSSDSVPTHLLTAEAMGIYLKQMREDGVIAIHISNRYFNLLPVIVALAEHHQLSILPVRDPGDVEVGADSNLWVLLSRSATAFELPELQQAPKPDLPEPVLWTDSHSSLLPLLIR